MAVTRPGEREWEGLLIGVVGPSEDGLWLSMDSDLDGWEVTFDHDDLRTPVGAAPGRAVVQPMYPTIIGLCVETAEDLAALEASKESNGLADLSWWDPARDAVATAPALLRRVEPSTARGVQVNAHRTVDVQWFVPRPGDITWDGS